MNHTFQKDFWILAAHPATITTSITRIIVIALALIASVSVAAEPTAAQFPPEPAWKRLGLPDAPIPDSGKGIGVVVIDEDWTHNKTFEQLGERLWILDTDWLGRIQITQPNLLPESKGPKAAAHFSHGAKSLQQMSHLPFSYQGQEYIGLAPAAAYFVVPFEGRQPKKLRAAVAWIVKNRQKYNLRIIQNAGWHIDDAFLNRGESKLRNTEAYQFVQALKPAVQAGLLVVEHNGNSAVTINLPPDDYLAVGAYQDYGRFDRAVREDNPDEPFGRNGDGHFRPDIRAPRFHVPNHLQPDGKLGHYGGTSCASAQMAGLCANLWAQFPDVDAKTLKAAVIQGGEPLPGSPNHAPIVNAAATIDLLRRGAVKPLPPSSPPVLLTDWRKQLESSDEIERALAGSYLAGLEDKTPFSTDERATLCRRLLADSSPIVRIIALGLADTGHLDTLLKLVRSDPHPGVRGWSAMALLGSAALNDDKRWNDVLMLLYDPNWTVRFCVNRVWDERFPKGPKFIIAWNPQDVKPTADKLVELSRESRPVKEADAHNPRSSPSHKETGGLHGK